MIVQLLQSTAEEFQAKIGRKFAPLLQLENVGELTKGLIAAIAEVSQEVFGKQRNKKQPWISNEALDLCDKRREKKSKRKNGLAKAEEYSNTNKEVRTKLREDKETWINQQCETLEREIMKNNMVASQTDWL